VAHGRGDNMDTNFGRGAPNSIWEGKNVPNKIWLKIQCIYAYNFAASGNNLMKLYQAICREVAVITRKQLLEGVPQQNLGGQ